MGYVVDKSEIRIETNAKNTSYLDWKVTKQGVDITETIQYEDDGKIVIPNIKAGVYSVTAIPKRKKSNVTDSFRNIIGDIKTLNFDIIVPLKFPQEEVSLLYYTSDHIDE